MKKTKQTLGIDLGSAVFKLAILEWNEGRPLLAKARMVELPLGADAAARQEGMKKLLTEISPERFSQVVVLVDDPFLCLQQLLVPRMPSAELPGAIRWELQRYLAVPPEEAIVDYQVLGEADVGGVKKLRLLVTAIPEGVVQDQLKILAQAGLRPTHLMPKAVAVAAWFNQRSRVGTAPVALLDLGAVSSQFLVVQEGRPVFARKIPVAGLEMTKAMTAVLMTTQGQGGFTETEAERIKREVGIPSADAPSTVIERGISSVQLLSLIRSPLERLAAELERSLNFYGESTPDENVTELILVGGGAQMKHLAQWLQDRLHIQVAIPSPLDGIPQATDAVEEAAAHSALSLVPVLGTPFGAEKGLNLLPPQLKGAVQTQIKRAVLTGGLAALLVGGILLWLGLWIFCQSLQKQMAAFQTEHAAILQEGVRARAGLAVQERLAQEADWEGLFKELSQVTPREIYLTGLSVEDRRVALRGRVQDLGRPADIVVMEFIHTLENGLLTQVRLTSNRQADPAGRESEFVIGSVLR